MSLVALRYDEADDVLEGLFASHKRLPGRLLHTAAGGELFDRIAAQAGYYPTRTEAALLDDYLPQIAHHVGPGARVVEPGHGEPRRTRQLIRALAASSYVPIDAMPERLHRRVEQLRGELPGVDVQPVIGDYSAPCELPAPQHAARRTLVFFPGSAIGSFEPGDARQVLARLATLAGGNRMLLLGADGTRDPDALLRAYDDDHGAIAAIHKAVLGELNRTRGANFEPGAFDHRAVWNAFASRVELQLVSRRRQTVAIAGAVVALAAGEPIVTEHCYKHTPAAMHAILTRAGWRPRQVFTSTITPFRLWLCEPLGGIRV
jgi:dimethylhistidine N-methyltransferase